MTEQLKNQIRNAINEEQSDYDKYNNFYKLAKEENYCKAGIFLDLANEEKSHKQILENLL